MLRTNLLLILFFSIALFEQGCSGQLSKSVKEDLTELSADENAYLYRKHIDKDSTWIEPYTNCFYLENAGMNMKHGGWHWAEDLEKKESNFFYWEAETVGMVKLEFDLPKGITALNFDTISKLNYDLLNYFYGYARTDSTIDKLSGILTFTKDSDKQIKIDGKINIDTEKPVTHQEIVFKRYNLEVSTLSKMISDEKSRSEEWKKQITDETETDNFISNERNRFYDSIFNTRLFPNNQLKATVNNKSVFDFHLSKSYLLTDARLSESVKKDLTELLAGNPLIVEQGNKNVFVFHSLYDPIKNSIDDETNYSLNIEMGNIIVGKSYQLSNKQNEIATRLNYWHYGPNGSIISSKETTGTLKITENNAKKISGAIDLEVLNNDKTHFHIKGNFELPKITLKDISDFETNLKLQVIIK